MRYSTRLKIEFFVLMTAIYTLLAGAAVFLTYRVYAGYSQGWLTFGRNEEWRADLATEPYLFWFFASVHGLCVMGTVALFLQYARIAGHFPFNRR
ncbi:hypothetical protein G6L37_05050 [Agrobacterium rubi]|nr:hypothetical protein [Agrobacterium rubi]NTF24723.1 hypothetical protein [Agrobacterium rubi]